MEDLEAVLQEDLGDEADRLVSVFCTRYSLRLAMLQFPLHTGSTHELRWVVAEPVVAGVAVPMRARLLRWRTTHASGPYLNNMG